MKQHFIRTLIQKTGFDLHRYRKTDETNKMEYLRECSIRTVIDVGANIGQFAKEVRAILPDASIYSFEPVQECYRQLLHNMSADTKFQAFNCALGDTNGKIAIHKNDYSQSSSILDMADAHKRLFPHTSHDVPEEITVKRLDDMTEMRPVTLEKNILLKIDTQGFEDRVIRGGPDFLKETKAVLAETSFLELYKGQPLFADIYKTLTSQGFRYTGSFWQKINPENGQVLFEDSLFVRN